MRRNDRVVSWNLNGEIRDRNVEWLSTRYRPASSVDYSSAGRKREKSLRSFLHQLLEHRSETSFRVVSEFASFLPFSSPSSVENEYVPNRFSVRSVELLTIRDDEVEIGKERSVVKVSTSFELQSHRSKIHWMRNLVVVAARWVRDVQSRLEGSKIIKQNSRCERTNWFYWKQEEESFSNSRHFADDHLCFLDVDRIFPFLPSSRMSWHWFIENRWSTRSLIDERLSSDGYEFFRIVENRIKL